MKPRSAFTLIEVLAVIGIIALLAAITFPVLATSRAKGRTSVCLSNLHQVHKSLRMYADDYDGTWPDSLQWEYWSDTHPEIAGCPSVPQGEAARAEALRMKRGQLFGVPGYAYNSAMNNGVTGINDAQIAFPATTVVLCEQEINGRGGSPLLTFPIGPDPFRDLAPYPYGQVKGWARHQGGGHYSFCDGHVKWLRPEGIGHIGERNNGTTPSFDPLPEGAKREYN